MEFVIDQKIEETQCKDLYRKRKPGTENEFAFVNGVWAEINKNRNIINVFLRYKP